MRLNFFILLLLQCVSFVFATTLHEFTRAATSTMLGDKKPGNEGKLTLNPAKHFEPIGFILGIMTGFGWGQPVSTNAMFYKNRKRDTILTATMPIVANLVVAAICGVLFKIFGSAETVLGMLLISLLRYNVSLAVYNLVPISPMDGLKIASVLMPSNTYFKYIQYEKVLQVGFLLLLFMGYTDLIFDPIISFVMMIFGI